MIWEPTRLSCEDESCQTRGDDALVITMTRHRHASFPKSGILSIHYYFYNAVNFLKTSIIVEKL